MIKAEELRIGNFIFCDELETEHLLNSVVQVTSFTNKVVHWKAPSVFTVNKHSGTPLQYANPIPLTTEILEQCGFEKKTDHAHAIGEYYWFDNGRFETVHVFNNWITLKGIDSCPIKYLHQLQNLYFALTNEELNFQYVKELK